MHIQKTVSTYLYSLYITQEDTKPTAICNTRRYKTKTQYLNVNLDCFFYIGHSLFDIRREAGYLLEIRMLGQRRRWWTNIGST